MNYSSPLKDNYIRLKDVLAKGYSVENNLVSLDVQIIGHFGNSVSLIIAAKNVIPYSAYNNTENIGFIIKYLVELLGIGKEDGLLISKVKDVPARLIFDSKEPCWGAKCVGIGNFMEDKFIMFDVLAKMDKQV